jgi:hypothetical protein
LLNTFHSMNFIWEVLLEMDLCWNVSLPLRHNVKILLNDAVKSRAVSLHFLIEKVWYHHVQLEYTGLGERPTGICLEYSLLHGHWRKQKSECYSHCQVLFVALSSVCSVSLLRHIICCTAPLLESQVNTSHYGVMYINF